MNGDLWWSQDTPIGPITVLGGDGRVRSIAFSDAWGTTLQHRGQPGCDRKIARALDDWFAGKCQSFDLEVDLSAVPTEFGRDVLTTLRRDVGWGETVSYGELAVMAGRPGAARGVGGIMRNNPVPFIVPCHRVVAAGGKLGGYGGGASAGSLGIKRWLLAHEGTCLV